ncbi:hypothetical protein BZA05DRAFT_344772 [Tricharina praecox]|uniref:uncharacterized protein n=1 Tax=Tricharina praecox TaxID=43433 RepID=UPI002220191E|nr:uncharacterized protein BZA05DRAFT_344772 [Tricharina praecox]KAI5841718.1 hypothetical protein BZA05DRAFT_344772 [Tricharina praecox]
MSLVVDCVFLGMTPLYCAEEPTVDISSIVAVTGLAGHAYESWTSPGGPWMWLRDFLPSDLETRGQSVRILTFGYDSGLIDTTATPSIQDYARALFDSLSGERTGDNALADASQQKEEYEKDKAILRSCTGLFFFGVPNRGLNIRNLRTLVQDQNNEYFVNDLREGSELLRQAYQRFTQSVQLEGCQITSCYELRDTQAVIVDPRTGRWITGEMIRVVTQDSATYALPTDPIHMQLGIDADHLSMVKFTDPFDHRYSIIRERLSQCVAKAPGIVEARVPKPIFMAPSWANSCFVGREEVLSRLENLLSPDGERPRRAAMHGLGGVGKTTIAIEFCRRWKKAQPGDHIFWIHGESHEAFNMSYLELGKEAAIDGHGTTRGEPSRQGLGEVKKWLDSPASGNWIMIIDNFDDIDSYPEKYLPIQRGAILYGTRDGAIVLNRAYVPPDAGVDINAMTEAEGVEMFSKLLSIDEAPSHHIFELLSHLEKLPLAIEQAAAFIRVTRVGVLAYMEMFKECERNQRELLEEQLPSTNLDRRPESRAVMTTWRLTFSKIQDTSPDSVKLLEYMSFLSSDDISEELLRGLPFLSNQSDVRFKKAFGPLISFALIYKLESPSFRLHRLVGLYIRTKMDSDDPHRRNHLLKIISEMLSNNFPHDMFGNYARCLYLFPHAAAVVSHDGNATISNPPRNLKILLSLFMLDKGDFPGALVGLQKQLDLWENTLGKEHPDTLRIVSYMAIGFLYLADYDKALVWYQRALDGREKALGKDHLHTLNTITDMAGVFKLQRDYDKASLFYQRALEGKEKILGKDHADTLDTVTDMADMFTSQGNHGKALEWYQWALDSREKIHGKDHPDTLRTVSDMACVFTSQGNYGKALVWYQWALDGREKTLGKDHRDTLDTVHDMADVFTFHGDRDKALVWYQRALEGKEKILGNDHLDTLGTVTDMALLFTSWGDYGKALMWYQRALDSKEKTLGKDHPDTLDTARDMAALFTVQGDRDKALVWYQRVIDGYEKVLGHEHPTTLRAIASVTNILDWKRSSGNASIVPAQAVDDSD